MVELHYLRKGPYQDLTFAFHFRLTSSLNFEAYLFPSGTKYLQRLGPA